MNGPRAVLVLLYISRKKLPTRGVLLVEVDYMYILEVSSRSTTTCTIHSSIVLYPALLLVHVLCGSYVCIVQL